MRRATRKIVPLRPPARRWRWRWRVRPGVVWFLAFAGISGGHALLVPVVDDWRSGVRVMTRDCRVAGVVDGDTVDLACAGRGTMRARIVGYDAPELFSPRCAAERVAAERARQALASWAWHASSTEVAFLGRDDYGRELVDMRLSGQRVAEGMAEGGYGRRYLGGLRGSWC